MLQVGCLYISTAADGRFQTLHAVNTAKQAQKASEMCYSRSPGRCCLCPCWGSGAARSAVSCGSCWAGSLGTSPHTPSPAGHWGRRAVSPFFWPTSKSPSWCLNSSHSPVGKTGNRKETDGSDGLVCHNTHTVLQIKRSLHENRAPLIGARCDHMTKCKWN